MGTGAMRTGIWVGAGALLALLACRSDRDFENPYLPGSREYAGDEWAADADGNGIADSVEKYLPECALPPKACLENAKILSSIPADRYALTARNMLLWAGDSSRSPDLDWAPAEAALRGYRLASSDSTVVRVKDGKLAPVTAGSAQINVTVPGMEVLGTSFIAMVAARGKRVDSVQVRNLSVIAGRDTVPEITWFPPDAAYRDYSLSTDRSAVATVTGPLVRAIASGSARMTLLSLDGGRKAAFTVTVIDPVRGTALSADPLFLVKGEPPQAPILTWTPAGTTDKRYRLVEVGAGSNVFALSADKQQIIPLEAGAAQVLAVSADGNLTAEFKVTVSASAVPVAGITAGDLDLVLNGDPQPPRLGWIPVDATNRRYTLSTEDSGVAVPAAGRVAPVGMGTAGFRVTTLDGAYSAAFKVTVGLPDTSLHVDSVKVESFSLSEGDSRRVVPVWYPPNAGDLAFTLSSPDSGVISVAGATVTARKAGTARLRLTASDLGRTADFQVIVYAPDIPVQQVAVESLSIYVGAKAAPTVVWTPANATNQAYELETRDTALVKTEVVSGVGRITGKAVGVATVILKSANGPSTSFTVIVNAAPIPVAAISVPNFTMALGDSARAPSVSFQPANATDKTYDLSVTPSGIVSLSQGKVSAVAAGKAFLTVTPRDNASARAVCTVTVVSMVRSVAAKDDTLRVGAGDKAVAGNLTWDPPNASDKSFTLKSGDTSLVKIAANGTSYRGVAPGKASVIVRALDGSGKADTFQVTVQMPVSKIGAADVSLKTGVDTAYNPWGLLTWTPTNATNKNWTLAYAAPNAVPAPSAIVGIPNGWQLKAVGPGSARIIVISQDNPAAKDTFTVTVIRPVAGLSATNLGMKLGDPDQPAPVTVNPSDASDKGFTLASGNPAVATVAPGNKIHAAGGGTATFTATSTYDGSKSITFTVTVTVPVVSVTAADTGVRIGEGDKAPRLTWNPANATNKTYSLTSLNTSLVTIASNQLHGVSPGTAKVVVTAADGGKLDTFAVTVVQPVTGVSAANLTARKGNPDTVPVVTWSPANATNKGYTLGGGNATVASVVGDKIHAINAGSVIMTLTAADNGKVANFTVTVVNPVTGIDGGPDISIRTTDPDEQPKVTVHPPDATNKAWHLVSTDESVATIVNGTYIHPVSRGDIDVIVVSDDDPRITATIRLSVRGMLGF